MVISPEVAESIEAKAPMGTFTSAGLVTAAVVVGM
jgi:hypothetical protein